MHMHMHVFYLFHNSNDFLNIFSCILAATVMLDKRNS